MHRASGPGYYVQERRAPPWFFDRLVLLAVVAVNVIVTAPVMEKSHSDFYLLRSSLFAAYYLLASNADDEWDRPAPVCATTCYGVAFILVIIADALLFAAADSGATLALTCSAAALDSLMLVRLIAADYWRRFCAGRMYEGIV